MAFYTSIKSFSCDTSPLSIVYSCVDLATPVCSKSDCLVTVIFPHKPYRLISGEPVKILDVCNKIEKELSFGSQVFYPSDPGYNQSIYHDVTSSTIRSVCSVLPDTANDVATIVSDTTFFDRAKVDSYVKVCSLRRVIIEFFDLVENSW